MSPYQYVYLAFLHPLVNLFLVLGAAETVEVVHVHRQSFQPLGKSVVVLECQDGVRHQHCHLLGVAHGLEGGTDGHLGLAKSHVATHQAVHRKGVLHVVFHLLSGLQLVRCVLIEERCLQLFLQIAVRAEGKSLRSLALGVECYQVLGNVLYLFFGLLLQHLPSVAA